MQPHLPATSPVCLEPLAANPPPWRKCTPQRLLPLPLVNLVPVVRPSAGSYTFNIVMFTFSACVN